MLFENLRVRPAPRAIELDHAGCGVLQARAVHAILVAVEREHASVAAKADAGERVEDDLRRKSGVGRRLAVGG